MTRRSVDRFFDGYAAGFDAIYGHRRQCLPVRLANRILRKSMRLRFEKTMQACQPIEGRTVLDVGCGSGHYGITLARMGAARIVGVDFAPAMLELAREYARRAGVADRCEFVEADFRTFEAPGKFDYAVVMGVMDYVDRPEEFVGRVVAMTKRLACFSFPVDGGLLAFQRKLRYRRRCPLHMYTEKGLRDILDRVAPGRWDVERIARDFFVTVRPAEETRD